MKITESNNTITGTQLDVFSTACYALGNNWGKQLCFNKKELLEAYERCNRVTFHNAHCGLFSPTPNSSHSEMLFKLHPSNVGSDGIKAYLFTIGYDRVYAYPQF